jgi:hypothetical protein
MSSHGRQGERFLPHGQIHILLKFQLDSSYYCSTLRRRASRNINAGDKLSDGVFTEELSQASPPPEYDPDSQVSESESGPYASERKHLRFSGLRI